MLASASTDRVKLWDAETGSLLRSLDGPGSVHGFAFSPDGRLLAVARFTGSAEQLEAPPDGIKLYHPSTGAEVNALRGANHPTFALAFSADGRRLAMSDYRLVFEGGQRLIRTDHRLGVWDPDSGTLLAAFSLKEGSCGSLTFSPDGKHLAGIVEPGDGKPSKPAEARVWDAETGRELLSPGGHEGHVASIVYSPDGQLLATAGEDGVIKLSSAATGEEVRTLHGHAGAIDELAFTADGTRLASASRDQTVRLWDPATGRTLLTLRGHTAGMNHLAFSPDSHFLAVGGGDHTVKLYDARPMPEDRPPPRAVPPNSDE
jgi:WD40 repeat protein